jgi:cell wall-associated NlpC family hydrolase
MKIPLIAMIFLIGTSCNEQPVAVSVAEKDTIQTSVDTIKKLEIIPDTARAGAQTLPVNTGKTSRGELIAFAKTLTGIPYKYASTDPSQGFDCSGFITYVFQHFNITVPRSSVDFTNVGKDVDVHSARTGDLILFTGTDSTVRVVGHMGIVTENTDSLRFIHSTSGKADGVTITALNKYYQGRFVKVINIFAE